ncbi:MAG: membrane fusion protein (multidrug efflux system) [Halieaceae bacterium]|jgi:membrane fusion protein (multidrug efflux system)
MEKRKQQLCSGRLLSVALLLCGLSISTQLSAQGVPVVVTTVNEETVYRQLEVTGSVTSARHSQLSAATSGQVQTLLVDAGSLVKIGDILLTLDPELADLELAAAAAQVQQGERALADARRRLKEARQLAPLRSIAESVVRELEAEVAEDESALRRYQAEAGLRSATLARHTVKAPFDGVIAAKSTELGEWVTPGQSILVLVSTTELRLDFPVGEDYLLQLGADTQVSYRYGLSDETTRAGKIATLVRVSDPGDRTFLMRVQPESGDENLAPGMSVRATLKIPTGEHQPAVPRDALLRYSDGRSVVWVVKKLDGSFIAVEALVRPGLEFNGLVAILSGIKVGDKVVVRGNESLRPDQAVQPSDIAASSVISR